MPLTCRGNRLFANKYGRGLQGENALEAPSIQPSVPRARLIDTGASYELIYQNNLTYLDANELSLRTLLRSTNGIVSSSNVIAAYMHHGRESVIAYVLPNNSP